MTQRDSFLGTWRLRAAHAETTSGLAPSPLGEHVMGQIIYDGAGYMSAQLMAADRPHFSSKLPNATPAEEFKQAFLSFTSYYGTYQVDAAASTVTHTVIGASAPSWVGSEQLRYFTFNGATLTLRTPPIRGRDGEKLVQVLVWERAPVAMNQA